ncbi:MAG: 30S ribosomal protein S18 [Myxococcales bacterium]|jgi:small subunit ribosomal protein S18|nr:30S ribosomal protein S18 [Myxococcales bacterium]
MDEKKYSRRASLLAIDKTLVVDYKNPQLLRAFLTDRGKIVPARISGVSARQQRQITKAIKRARILALIPFTVS